MSIPAVSIITCTYNRAHLISETIESVLNQTFTDFEYIIVDESSVDNTEEVVNRYRDPRIRYYKIPNTKGHLSKLRNFGMTHSAGRYIAFVDSDDLWHHEKLGQQINAFETDSLLGFSYTDVETFDSKGIIQKSIYNKSGYFKGSVFDEFIQNNFVICATTLFFKKDCLNVIGNQDEDFLSGDFDFIVSLASRFNAYVIYFPLVKVRRHNENVSDQAHLNRKFNHLKTLEKILENKIISKAKFKTIRLKVFYAFGMQLLRAKEYNWARHFFIKNIIANPFYVKAWLRLLISLVKKQVIN